MAINRIALYHLETLVWIWRLGTFAAAAEHLNTTQPAISARISELEDRLQAKLFRKIGRSMVLTTAGRELVQDYLPIWEQLQGALLRSAGFNQIGGRVRIGAGEIAAATCLPPFVANLKNSWPCLTFEIEIELTAQLIDSLIGGKIDLAFAAGLVAHPALKSKPIGAAELLWVASPASANHLADPTLRDTVPLWSLPNHSPLYQVMRNILGAEAPYQRSINLCNNVRTMIDIVTMGSGFSLLPKSMVRAQLANGLLVPVLLDHIVEPIMFHVVTRAAERDPIVLELLRFTDEIRLDAG